MDSAEHSADEAGASDRVLRLLATPEELAARRSAECHLERVPQFFAPGVVAQLLAVGQVGDKRISRVLCIGVWLRHGARIHRGSFPEAFYALKDWMVEWPRRLWHYRAGSSGAHA